MPAQSIVTEDLPFDANKPLVDFSAYVGDDPVVRARLDQWRAEIRGRLDVSGYADRGRAWSHDAWIEAFAFMYDSSFYDRSRGVYRIDEYLDRGQREVGGYDVLLLWQSYPRLGIDRRNQFDLYREMPGGLEALRRLAERCHERSVRVFVNYNPWDMGTRREEQSDGEALAQIVRQIGADGVFLDTMHSADPDFRGALLSANPSCVFDPEGLMPTAELQNITGGWLQTGNCLPPMIPTIRWLEPRFVFRAIDRGTISRREPVLRTLFYGCGQVFWENIFGFWNPWSEDDLSLLRGVRRILHEHRNVFTDPDWQPFIGTLVPGVYANRWQADGTTIYTLLNALDHPVEGPLLSIEVPAGMAAYDLLEGTPAEARASVRDGLLTMRIPAHDGACVGVLKTAASRGASPAPRVVPRHPAIRTPLSAHTPHPVAPTPCLSSGKTPVGMRLVPGGRFVMNVRHNTSHWMEGACYGSRENVTDVRHPAQHFWIEPFFIDRTEVTNTQFAAFLAETRYVPTDLTAFLKHFVKALGQDLQPWLWRAPAGKAAHPVVYVDLTDARAYARWAGKRLPREEEWHYAAQGSDGRLWPWGNDPAGSEELLRHMDGGSAVYYGNTPDLSRCNSHSADTTPVDAFPSGASPFGVLDMAGNVWEWTESERDDGRTRYAILKGGSFAHVAGSPWYTASGAQPCDVHEKMLLMYPGLDRCETVGFRCVIDTE
jgi:gamma-glutamyl hercynylcysteine S-oxide synthase